VSHAGVHQAYQLALAAAELGELSTFYCALYDSPKKWGGLLARIFGHDLLVSRRVAGLDVDKVIELPWPLIRKAIRDRVCRQGIDDWGPAYDAFDAEVAKKIDKTPPDIFVGTSSSDMHCLSTAKRHGSALVHDCPGLHPQFQEELLREAANRAGIKQQIPSTDLEAREERRLTEYSLADILLLYSDFHRKSFEAAGHRPERIFVSPLWVDPHLWYRETTTDLERRAPGGPLRLLFVGSIDLRKGIPFLLKAVASCGSAVQLTIVGPRRAQTETSFPLERNNINYYPPQLKSQLRKIYSSHDVLVLPSVGDSFGFVALEAMACGIPVIVTENCGVPVPDGDWRVPAMDSESLANRIIEYVEDRTLAAERGKKAAAFAAQFGPEKYRQRIQTLFKNILNNRNEVVIRRRKNQTIDG
jgi:glycosyltransferase involved in cell wall biosynthesis